MIKAHPVSRIKPLSLVLPKTIKNSLNREYSGLLS